MSVRDTYYGYVPTCDRCGWTLKSEGYYEDAIDAMHDYGWYFDYDNDLYYCDECSRYYMRISPRRSEDG